MDVHLNKGIFVCICILCMCMYVYIGVYAFINEYIYTYIYICNDKEIKCYQVVRVSCKRVLQSSACT